MRSTTVKELPTSIAILERPGRSGINGHKFDGGKNQGHKLHHETSGASREEVSQCAPSRNTEVTATGVFVGRSEAGGRLRRVRHELLGGAIHVPGHRWQTSRWHATG